MDSDKWFENVWAYLADANTQPVKEKFEKVFPEETLFELLRDLDPAMLCKYIFFTGYVTRELEENGVFDGR